MQSDEKLSRPYRIPAALLSLGCFATSLVFAFNVADDQPALGVALIAIGGVLFGYFAITSWKGPSP